MLFKNEEASLKLEVLRYEFPADGGEPNSDDRNWLVLRGTYTEGDSVIVDSNSCLLTYELKELATELKVMNAGIKDSYESAYVEPYFEFAAQADGEDGFTVDVAFAMPNTMEDIDSAELECTLTKAELGELVKELDRLCERYPDRK
ncbi:MAG: hypothetical protein LKJ86_03080 [Oscillibacter sp.]|jgi:hypothetical protein|nr:hypothetical protein [Oscillibacter sp.]